MRKTRLTIEDKVRLRQNAAVRLSLYVAEADIVRNHFANIKETSQLTEWEQKFVKEIQAYLKKPNPRISAKVLKVMHRILMKSIQMGPVFLEIEKAKEQVYIDNL